VRGVKDVPNHVHNAMGVMRLCATAQQPWLPVRALAPGVPAAARGKEKKSQKQSRPLFFIYG